MLNRTESITTTAQGLLSEYSKIRPLYAASHKLSLQEVLHGAGLTFPVSSVLMGENHEGELMTLEEFLITSNLPQPATKNISISISSERALALSVRRLYVRSDVLFMEVIGGGRECTRENGLLITRPDYPIGLVDHHVRNINRLELEGGLLWKQ